MEGSNCIFLNLECWVEDSNDSKCWVEGSKVLRKKCWVEDSHSRGDGDGEGWGDMMIYAEHDGGARNQTRLNPRAY